MKIFTNRATWIVAVLLLFAATWSSTAYYFGLTQTEFLPKIVRVVASQPLAVWHRKDLEYVETLTNSYWHGMRKTDKNIEAGRSWRAFSDRTDVLRFIAYSGARLPLERIPVVHERIDAPHLVELRRRENFGAIYNPEASEYEKILSLANWVGSLFDHGRDIPPGGYKVDRVADVVSAGKMGAKFWCEVAARIMTHTATAMGWPARLVTISRDGYDWNHAVTEVWSNQFEKWFQIDTDFNVVYEISGVPQSVFDLVTLRDSGESLSDLKIRKIAPAKRHFLERDGVNYYEALLALELFNYAHIDMRTDWATRKLSRGSPAGGDLATRRFGGKGIGPLLTAIPEYDDYQDINWPLNSTAVLPRDLTSSQGLDATLNIGVTTYSPYFRAFEYSLNDGDWLRTTKGEIHVRLARGYNRAQFRVITQNGSRGPVSSLDLVWEVEANTSLSLP